MNSYNVSSVEVGCIVHCGDFFRATSECAGIFGRREANGGTNLPKFSRAIHCGLVD